MDILVTKTSKPGTLPQEDKLGFGKYFTDHMFVMDYQEGKGWHSPKIVPYGEFPIYPSALVFHYGQATFEGMKAYRTVDDRIVLFRPKDYLNRFNNSNKAVCIPPIEVDFVHQALKKLIEIDKHWVPGSVGTSLYIRPFIIATDPCVGVKVSDTYKLFVIMSPVGAYYASGFKPVKIKVEDNYTRAVKGGLGEAKTSANYAAGMKAGVEAKKEGFAQVLWLDALERKYIEEIGMMNILFKINDEIITPPLAGSILSGRTRLTIIDLANDLGLKVTERKISILEIYEAHEKGQLQEVFGAGTAAVISPVGELTWKGKTIVVNDNKTGPTAQKLFDTITGIQYGKLEDKYGWIDTVAKL